MIPHAFYYPDHSKEKLKQPKHIQLNITKIEPVQKK